MRRYALVAGIILRTLALAACFTRLHLFLAPGVARAQSESSSPAREEAAQRFVERPAEELYDLRRYPYEMHNLAGDPKNAARLASMGAEVTAWMKQQGDTQTVFGKPLLIGEPVTLLG